MENKLKKRTGVDFSKHELNIIKEEHVLIYDLKQPDCEYTHRVKFINTCGILAVTGDFGNWIFCREFHPSADGYVSEYYWIEKLKISSEQEPYDFDNDLTEQSIREGLDYKLEEYGYEDIELKEMKDYYTNLLDWVQLPEWEYISYAYNNIPSFLSAEQVPNIKSIKHWLLIIFDAFDEICNRLKMQEGDIK